MSEHPEVAKVVSDNPAHIYGYVLKNVEDLTDADVIYVEQKNGEADEAEDQFSAMDVDELKAYLTENGQTPHHLAKEGKLRAACRAISAALV